MFRTMAAGAAALLMLGAGYAMAQSERHEGMVMSSASPLTEPGQAAFGAIHEVVERLDADPNTDWSKINIDKLREHLVDMDEVTLHAQLAYADIPGGEQIRVTGSGRTLEAIQRMVIGHATSMGDAEHWTMTAASSSDGAVVTVRPKSAGDMARIHALGLLGMMAEGSHHQTHHWFLATGVAPHH
jgi:hypothetical protein